MFNKVEIGVQTANVAEINEKKIDRASGQAGSCVLVAPTPSPEATNSQVVMGEGVDEGLYLESAPLVICPSVAELCFAIFLFI